MANNHDLYNIANNFSFVNPLQTKKVNPSTGSLKCSP